MKPPSFPLQFSCDRVSVALVLGYFGVRSKPLKRPCCISDTFSMKLIALFLLVFGFIGSAKAKEFQIFDGRYYNGLYYPRVDIIEWGNEGNYHLEFHVYSKDKPLDLAVVTGEKNGRPVVWINYDMNKLRNERVCRHAPAPPNFRKGEKLYTYRDNSHPEYDNIYFSSTPMKTSKSLVAFEMQPYYICPSDEMASNMPDGPLPPGYSPPTAVAQAPTDAPANAENRAPASVTPDPQSENREGKGLNIDYENTIMPFSF